jgi:alanine racemase
VSRWAWAEVDLGAIEHNVAAIARQVAPSRVWAVVKADGYGHGSVHAARAALSGGATGLCVALVQEGLALREGGIDAPVLLLSEQPADDLPAAVSAGLSSTVYSERQIDLLVESGATGHPVHLKIDTGMRRVGCRPEEAPHLAARIAAAAPALRFEGVFTHLAVADEPGDPFTIEQLDRFDRALAAIEAVTPLPPLVHAANSAGALAHPAARRSMVRIGIGAYGISPGPGVDDLVRGLRPALSLRSRVSFVQHVAAGDGISYGLRHRFDRPSTVAVVPLGYADGVPRRLSSVGGSVLIGGRRRPIVGVVTMDQLMVDLGDDDVERGDEVVLIGDQGDERILAAEWADLLGTIGYEVVCGISKRIERRYR